MKVLGTLTCSKRAVQFYGSLKGLAPHAVLPAAVQMAHEFGLAHRLDAQPAQLSGGEKRKLSVAIALIADSQVVFLDEARAPAAALSCLSAVMH
jgi:ABC-type multidrug transport system ATPase subunit